MTNEITTPIPARLKNVAENGHVAGAEDIYDDSLQFTQAEINAMMLGGSISVALTASPTAIFVGIQSTVNLVAASTQSANISIKKGSTIIATGNNKTSQSGSDIVTPESAGTISYSADFQIGGLSKSAQKAVSVVNKIYYGSGSVYSDAVASPSARTSPAGTYNVNVATDGKYIFFNVPNTMTINGATMGGFEFPLDSPTAVTIDGVPYKSYRSSNTLDAGNYQIVIS